VPRVRHPGARPRRAAPQRPRPAPRAPRARAPAAEEGAGPVEAEIEQRTAARRAERAAEAARMVPDPWAIEAGGAGRAGALRGTHGLGKCADPACAGCANDACEAVYLDPVAFRPPPRPAPPPPTPTGPPTRAGARADCAPPAVRARRRVPSLAPSAPTRRLRG